jgi:hypothetical protein
MNPKLSLPTILSQITEVYSPRLVAIVNREYDIKIAKIRGLFIGTRTRVSDQSVG